MRRFLGMIVGSISEPNVIGLPRYWERDPDDRNDDPALHFRSDAQTYFPQDTPPPTNLANHSLELDVDAEDGQRRGIHQFGIPVRQDMTYRGYLWLKTAAFSGHITVALEAPPTGGETYASAEIPAISADDWTKYEFTLRSSKTDPSAKFAVLFSYGRGRVWMDQVSLIPGDAIDGVRPDVFELLKRERPAFIRWPGGNVAQDYHWTWGVGPRDRRATWVNLSWANELEPGDIGTDEFVRLCRNLGAQPSITVNVEGRGATASEAAAWVEYANGPATSRQGAAIAGAPSRDGLLRLGEHLGAVILRLRDGAAPKLRNPGEPRLDFPCRQSNMRSQKCHYIIQYLISP